MAMNGGNVKASLSVENENIKSRAIKEDPRERLRKWQEEKGRLKPKLLPWESNRPKKTVKIDDPSSRLKENANPNLNSNKVDQRKFIKKNLYAKHEKDSKPPKPEKDSKPPSAIANAVTPLRNKREWNSSTIPVSLKKSKMETEKVDQTGRKTTKNRDIYKDLDKIIAHMEKIKTPKYVKGDQWRVDRRMEYARKLREQTKRHTIADRVRTNQKQRDIRAIPGTSTKKPIRRARNFNLENKEPVKFASGINLNGTEAGKSVSNSSEPSKLHTLNANKKLGKTPSTEVLKDKAGTYALGRNRNVTSNVKSRATAPKPVLPNKVVSSPKSLAQQKKKFTAVTSRYLNPKKVQTVAKSTTNVQKPEQKRKPFLSSRVANKAGPVNKPVLPSRTSGLADKVSFAGQKAKQKEIPENKPLEEPEVESNEVGELNRTFEKEQDSSSKSISIFIPLENETPLNASARMKRRSWLEKRRTVSNFRHMRCFETSMMPEVNRSQLQRQRRSVGHSTPKTPMKFSSFFCNKTEPKLKSSSLFLAVEEVPEVKESNDRTEDNGPESVSPNLEEVLEDILASLEISEAYPLISEKLDNICEANPEVQKMALYWICRANVAALSNNMKEALRLFDLAKEHEAEPEEKLLKGFEVLKEKFSSEDLPPVQEEELPSSSVVQFFVKTPHKRISDYKLYTVTPVRRSMRHSQVIAQPNFETDLPACVESLEGIPFDVRKSLLFKPNPALNDWNIDVKCEALDFDVDD